MKVLMLSWEYPPYVVGGLGSHVADLLPALDRLGGQVELVTPRWRGGSRRDALAGGSQVHRVDPPVPDLADFLPAVRATNASLQNVAEVVIEQAGPFDVIHVHDWLVCFAAIALKHQFRIPLVATIHATERGRTGGDLYNDLNVAVNGNEWWLTYEAWRVITTTHYMANQCRDYFGTPLDKLDIVANGVNTERFDRLPVRGSPGLVDFRRRFARDDEQIVFHVGRLVGEKGAQLLVEAAPRVLMAAPGAKFVIAGRGPLLAELQQRTWDAGLGAHFYFAGFISDDERDLLYRVADCAVFPSLYEPFGIVALEAMAARAPVVVSKTGGLAEVVDHNDTGIHVWPGDADSLAWGIAHTLNRPDWSVARADNAYRKVGAVYNWDLIAEQTLAVFERVAAERAVAAW
jgi:glycosyltransferase involved in cell wall biosynthesis